MNVNKQQVSKLIDQIAYDKLSDAKKTLTGAVNEAFESAVNTELEKKKEA